MVEYISILETVGFSPDLDPVIEKKRILVLDLVSNLTRFALLSNTFLKGNPIMYLERLIMICKGTAGSISVKIYLYEISTWE